VRSVVLRRRRQQRRRTDEGSLLGACELIAADLRAGLTPEAALVRAAADWQPLRAVAAAAELGADVPGALRALAFESGLRDLVLVAASWQVSQRSGSALAAGMTRVATRLRQARAQRRVVDSELASARATARLLAGLPLLALAMGGGVGGDPLRFLLATHWGLGCLTAGLAMNLAGLWWIDRIADSVADST
jgi:tight adherence protein B